MTFRKFQIACEAARRSAEQPEIGWRKKRLEGEGKTVPYRVVCAKKLDSYTWKVIEGC